jgi:hypothetical protein
MKFNRTLVLITSAALLLTACGKESDDAVVAVNENANPLLAYVPADTTYVFADLEPAPEEITDAYVNRFQPVLDVMSEQIKQFQANYEAGELQDNQMAHLAMAVLDELGGSLSKENLDRLGISLQAHHAIYAKGVFPVIRLGLSDAEALRQAIARIEENMGYALPLKNLNGTSYWRISDDGMPVAIYVAIGEQQLALSVFPVNAEDTMLAAFLGQEMPAQSMATSNALAIMNKNKAYTGYGSGYVDFQKLSNEILNPDSNTRTIPGSKIDAQMASLDAVCIDEIKSIIAKAPRMTAGFSRFTANEVAMRYDLEIEGSLANGLAALVSDIPSAAEGNHLLSASLAIKVGKLRNFVLEKATDLVSTPYQCSRLQDVNRQAEQLLTQLNIPMPPMINNLLGVRVQMDDFDPAMDIIRTDGLLALHVDKPEMFVGMASMMVPGFEELDLANQSEPVRIPAEMMNMEGIEVFALMGDNAIGVSIGEQHVKDLATFMSAKSEGNGTLFSASYDMAKQMEIQAALAGQYQVDVDDNRPNIIEYSEAMKEVYMQVLDRSRVDIRLTTEGLVIENSMTFK